MSQEMIQNLQGAVAMLLQGMIGIFVVLGIVYFMKYFTEQNPKEKKYIYVYLAAVFVLFIMFYPVLTGMEVPTAYVNTALRWLPTWFLG